MSTETKEAVKKLTITLTDRPPVKITEADWPVIADGSWKDWDNTYEFQANRTWAAWLKVRQHADGRTIVYGGYSYTTQFQNESGASYREGQMITPSAEDYPEAAQGDYWTGQTVIDAIHAVGERLAERSGQAEHFADIIAETIADFPAQELS